MKTNKSTLSQVKGMPNAPEAEQAVNGSLLSFGGDKVFDAISSDLSTDMFFDIRNAILYEAIRSLYASNKPCDIVSVTNEIRSMGKIEEVPPHFIAETLNHGYDSFHAVEHALMIKQKYLQRKAIELSHILQQQAYDDTEDIGDVLFNAGKALVMEGRAFSEREYANGDDVCLVSAAFADINGVTVGDTVEIDYYDCGISENHFLSNIDKVQIRRTMMPSERIGLKKKYTVVGIYTSPEFSDGSYNFTADTVFVPKKSVPDAEKYEKHDVPYLNATVIKNGQVEEFEKYMAEHGMGGYYRYFDMGFESAAPTLEALVANATRVIAIAMSLLVLVAAVGIYLTFMRMKPVIRSERLVGVKRGTVWCGISGVFSAVIGISVALGALLGALLYGNITKAIFETSVELNLPALIACTAGEFVLLTAAAMLAAVPAASPNLMNSGRVKRKK